MDECVFCKIVQGEIPAHIVYESDHVVAFPDIDPQAPAHFLIIPKKHISSIVDMEENDKEILWEIQKAVVHLAHEFELAEKGFRIVNNCGEEGGQTVYHLHFHLIGGRSMLWPPG